MIHHLQHIADLVEICELKGLKHIVISPGSRNAPLFNLFYRNGNFQLHSIVDERSAAFYGLGIALATGEAVALLCTSGTAVLNFAPALAEAYYQRVPLIAITADRPEHLIDQQDNQTIRQVNVFQNYIKNSIHLHQPIHDIFELDAQHYGINNLLNSAISGIKGPVHINVPIAEPFYIDLPLPSPKIKISAPEENETSSVEELSKAWNASSRRMIICGEGVKNEKLTQLINSFAENAVVLAEPISNINGKKIIAEVDRLMMNIEPIESDDILPDLLISFGGPVVSKRLKKWLQKQKNLKHFRIAEEEDQIDTYQNLTHLILGQITEIIKELDQHKTELNTNYISAWHSIYQQNKTAHHAAFKGLPYSDIQVFNQIIKQIPIGSMLHLGNSSPVRYGQLFDLSVCDGVYSNRGVSGIDGCLSTAAGFASQSDKTNIAILGDLSFLYDSNGLWNSKLSKKLKIIVVNNNGGGIFRLLPGPSEMDAFEEFIETNHPVNIEKLVAAFGLEYFGCDAECELESILQRFMKSKSGPSLLEIKTPRLENAVVYKMYVERIKTNIS
jgi:2-succinyl-5-enolpyruvyl-6-hydroxy-3-cyclohexene-1-carboxylate synthase